MSEQELLKFARTYMSEGFPNPERTGCPPDSALSLMAIQPREADASVSEHLTCCSPCFNRYMDLLAQVELEKVSSVKNAFAWIVRSPLRVTAAVALVLGLATSAYVAVDWPTTPVRVATTPSQGTRPPVPADTSPSVPVYPEFVLDMSHLSPIRGEQTRPRPKMVRIPQRPLDLILHLPLGSEEGNYEISLTANGQTFWAASAQARLRNHKMTLQVKADLSAVPPGDYSFQVESPRGVYLKQPVSLQGKEQGKQ